MTLIRLPGLNQSTGSSLTVNLTASGFRTFSAAPASTITLTMGSVVPGVNYLLKIPSGKFTTSNGLTFSVASNWNIFPPTSGYVYDPAKDTFAEFFTVADGSTTFVYVNTWQVALPDTVAPTVVSASATGSALTVVYSEAVITTATTGLSLNYTTGTARTITGITSGSGTTTIVYSLSGAVAGTDVATFVVAGGAAVADAAGNAVTAGSTSISFGAVMPQLANLLVWNNAAKQTVDGIPIATRVHDYSGNANHGTHSGLSIASNKFQFTGNSSTENKVAYGINCPTGDYTAIARVTATGSSINAYRGLWSSNNGGSGGNFFTGIQPSGNNPADGLVVRHTNDTDFPIAGYSTALGTTLHLIVAVYNSTTNVVTWYIDNLTTPVGTATPSADPTATPLVFGQYGTNSGSHWQGTVDAMALYNVQLDATERAQADAAL